MLNKQEFKSIEIYELSLSSSHSMQGKKTDKQFRRQKCEIERILKEYLSGIDLTDINKEFIVELFQRCIPKRGKADTKYLARFMHAGLEVGELVHVIADAHIYDRHLPIVEKLVTKESRPAPKLIIDPSITDFYAFTKDSFKLEGYEPNDFDEKIPIAI